jgi:tRNA(Ile)-lysidine synthase
MRPSIGRALEHDPDSTTSHAKTPASQSDYHPLVRTTLSLDTTALRPGMRLGVAVSGGADSVALLRALHENSRELGLVLHVAHLHHGLRGEEADSDLEFVRNLAASLDLPFVHERVDTGAEAKANSTAGKGSESIEEAARRLRYAWFRALMSGTPLHATTPYLELPHAVALHAMATAHTLDDQAETVLAKFLRGAWTEGLSGIHPVLEFPEGKILRPLLSVKRTAIEAYLLSIGQSWREDSTNRELTFTRNRIRHELLPLLESWNPRLREHLTQMAALARDEEAAWQAEVERVAPRIFLRGRPVRGGGRASADGLAIDLQGLAALPTALQRRILREAAHSLCTTLDFDSTESLRTLATEGRAGQKLELAQGLRAERSHRELRLTVQPSGSLSANGTKVAPEILVPVPGQIEAPEFGLRFAIEVSSDSAGTISHPNPAVLRVWRPGDRVRIGHSSRLHKVKEVLERMKVTGTSRSTWPVLEWGGTILWMRGVPLEPEPGIHVIATELDSESAGTAATSKAPQKV